MALGQWLHFLLKIPLDLTSIAKHNYIQHRHTNTFVHKQKRVAQNDCLAVDFVQDTQPTLCHPTLASSLLTFFKRAFPALSLHRTSTSNRSSLLNYTSSSTLLSCVSLQDGRQRPRTPRMATPTLHPGQSRRHHASNEKHHISRLHSPRQHRQRLRAQCRQHHQALRRSKQTLWCRTSSLHCCSCDRCYCSLLSYGCCCIVPQSIGLYDE